MTTLVLCFAYPFLAFAVVGAYTVNAQVVLFNLGLLLLGAVLVVLVVGLAGSAQQRTADHTRIRRRS